LAGSRFCCTRRAPGPVENRRIPGYDPLVINLSVVLFDAGRRSIMSRLRVAAVVIALLLVAGSVSYSCGRTYTFVDEANAPIDPIYVAYYHSGSRPNPVHPVSYRASPLRVIRSDAPGQLVIPGKLHVHLPFPIETHPSVDVELVYAPRVHNAWERLHVDAFPMPLLFGLDRNRRKATVPDLSAKPDSWHGTLGNLSSVINRLVAPRVDGSHQLVSTDRTTVALTRELIGHFRSELAAFLTTFAETPRQKPEMPPYARWSRPEEQQRWAESVEADLAREPTWGALIRRLYTDELRYFAEWEAQALTRSSFP
jgi:hypothetical protein